MMALALHTRIRCGLTINVVRIVLELYSELTAVTPSTIRRIRLNSSPGMLLVTGSDITRSASLHVSNGSELRPITSALAAEQPIESTTARPVKIQVDRTERSLVHSDTSVVSKPGCLPVAMP